MAQIDPKVQAILDELNNKKPSTYQTSTVTYEQSTNYENRNAVNMQNYSEFSQPSAQQYNFGSTQNMQNYSEFSQPPAQQYNFGNTQSMSQEEWNIRHPPTDHLYSTEHVKKSGSPLPESISQAEWVTRHSEQINKPMESISHEEWINRQSNQQLPVQTITQEEWIARQSNQQLPVQTITQEEWITRQAGQSMPMESITHEEWMFRQGRNNEVRSYVNNGETGYIREEGVKRSEPVYVNQNLTAYDYRDFRPKEFNYEYREYKPMQYETTVQAPVQRIVYEQSTVREERTKEKKPKVIFEEHEKRDSKWCC